MTPINGQRLFWMNGTDIWAGEDLESCRIAIGNGLIANPHELTDDEAHEEIDGTDGLTLAGVLEEALTKGVATPVMVARFEVEPEPEPEVMHGEMMMLPAPEGTCPLCATTHEAYLPHNAQSLFYQMRFNLMHKRGATWADAAAHCTDVVRGMWKAQLQNFGQAWTEPPAGVDPVAEPVEAAPRGIIKVPQDAATV